ncbi:MAG: PH domain-containing protein [Candidatus Heimdallarchaeota archaeon]|nr:MAG: PH domain-containing protein [Candidatus Heimdallarchaeota archaeon]
MQIKTIQKEKPFYPVSAFRNKLFLYIITTFIVVTGIIITFGGIIIFFVSLDEDPSGDGFGKWLTDYSQELISWYLIISVILMLLAAILVIFYVRNIEYIIEETEVIVRKGIINKTIKHVPFRTITNVSSRYGIYDRIFGIGTCEIETAGKSGQQTGPEEKIEGIRNFREVRDVVLSELRKFRGQYATTTEVEQPTHYEEAIGDIVLQKEVLDELRKIKEILAKNR